MRKISLEDPAPKPDMVFGNNNIDDANYLVTNHYYQKDVPIEQNKKLLKKFNLFKEYKVDDLIINSIYKIN